MNMLKIAICEDDPAMNEYIKSYISKACKTSPIEYSTECFLSGEDLLKKLNAGYFFDLIYLEISMEGISGIDVAKQLRERLCNVKTLLIFISSYEEKTIELFEYNTFRILIKPIDQDKFTKYFMDVCKYLDIKQIKCLEFKEIRGDKESVPFEDIIYLESTGRVIQLVTLYSKYFFYGKLKEIALNFQGEDFIRIHNSILVNFEYISLMRYGSVLLKNGETKDISGPKRKSVREVYSIIRRKRKL